jgi:hypothetical protein
MRTTAFLHGMLLTEGNGHARDTEPPSPGGQADADQSFDERPSSVRAVHIREAGWPIPGQPVFQIGPFLVDGAARTVDP